jgi:hypothetical protein
MEENALKAENARVARIWLGEDGILREEVREGSYVTKEDAEEINAVAERVLAGKRSPVVVLAHGTKSISRDARLVMAGEWTARLHSAVAIVFGSPLVAAIAAFFTGLNRPSFPVKTFSSEEAALQWLKQFVG